MNTATKIGLILAIILLFPRLATADPCGDTQTTCALQNMDNTDGLFKCMSDYNTCVENARITPLQTQVTALQSEYDQDMTTDRNAKADAFTAYQTGDFNRAYQDYLIGSAAERDAAQIAPALYQGKSQLNHLTQKQQDEKNQASLFQVMEQQLQ